MAAASSVNIEELKTQLEEYGFVIIRNLISADSATRMADRLMEIMLQRPDAEKPNQNLHAMLNHLQPEDCDLFSTLLTNPAFMELARHVLGEAFQLVGASGCNWWKPGAPGGGLHADVPVEWVVRNGLPVPNLCLMLNSLWMLTEFTRENGGTRLMPFSHHSGRAPRPRFEYEHTVVAEGPPGSIVIFYGRVWHGAGANVTSDSQRVGASIAYFTSLLNPRSAAINPNKVVLMKRSIRAQMPELVQRMSETVEED